MCRGRSNLAFRVVETADACPLGACARRCRFRSHCAPSTQASVVASASSAASGRPETAISVSLLARSHDLKRRPAGQTGVFALLQATLCFDLNRSNACCLLNISMVDDPEQIAVFNQPVLQQYTKNGPPAPSCRHVAASRARAQKHANFKYRPAGARI